MSFSTSKLILIKESPSYFKVLNSFSEEVFEIEDLGDDYWEVTNLIGGSQFNTRTFQEAEAELMSRWNVALKK